MTGSARRRVEEEEEERGQRCYCFLEQPGGTTGPFRKEGGGKVKQTNT